MFLYFNKKRKKNSRLLFNPQCRGVVRLTRIVTPKKPNSARRSTAKVILVNSYAVSAYIPGIGHNLRKHSVVLVKGGRCRDLPGVSYRCTRGVFDLLGVSLRLKRRSIFGVPRPDYLKTKIRRKFRQV